MATFLKGTKNLMGGALDATKKAAGGALDISKKAAGGALDVTKKAAGGALDVTKQVGSGTKNLAGAAGGFGVGIFDKIAEGMGAKSGSRDSIESASKNDAIKRRQSSFAKLDKKTDIATKIQLFRDINQPCDVYSWFEITVTDIDVVGQTFDCSIEVHLFWQDYMLPIVFPTYDEDAFEIDDDCLPLKMTEIFENAIDQGGVDPSFDYYEAQSCVYMFFVVEATFVERMELQRFPLDRQFLNMELNAYHGKSPTGNWNWILTNPKNTLEWVPKKYRNRNYYVRMVASISGEYELQSPWIDFASNQKREGDDENSKNAEFDSDKINIIGDIRRKSRSKSKHKAQIAKQKSLENSGKSKINEAEEKAIIAEPTPLNISLRVERRPHYYYGNILFPNFLIGLGCAGAFVVPPGELADRMGVLITLMLAAVAFRFVVSTMLPRISYLTLMDKYLLFSFCMIIVLIGENTFVAVEGLFTKDWIDAFDYTFCIGFYIGWVVIHVFFVLTMIIPDFYRISWKEMYELDTDDGDENEMVEARDYQFVKTKDESKECVERWQVMQAEQEDAKRQP